MITGASPALTIKPELSCVVLYVQDTEYSGLEDAPLGRRDAADAVVGDVLVSYRPT